MRLGVLITLLVLSFAARAAVSCGDQLAREGATRYDIINLCGEPDWRDGWYETTAFGVWSPIQVYDQVFIEQWYYNRGPDRFIRLFTFQNLRLVRIDHLGYGWVPYRRRQCKPAMFFIGISKYEVWFHCGEPAWAESWYGGQLIRPGVGVGRFGQVHFDTWIYDFGTSRFQRILHFQNGFLNFVEVGERGHVKRRGL
ncbi:MAG: DUF2845 domain-containing protein [Gammaproteobacteria bacterium]|nr:MAG: DUF2845 domain-containing protein [Gammaproteobacteria bacterium]